MCTLRSEACVNDLEQVLQEKCFSPVCALVCTLRSEASVNDFEQVSNMYMVSLLYDTFYVLSDMRIVQTISNKYYMKRVSPRCEKAGEPLD